ncbi:MAG: HAD-IA family hydrolase [Bacteroidota bacterium]|nr:HAD-IA family hydrolase [Bacteroidota bacterium]
MIRTVISDLGNVLLHFDHRIIVARLMHDFPDARWDDEQNDLFWALVSSFELGAVSEEGFLREAGVLLGQEAPLDADHFRRLWSDIFWLNESYLSLLQSIQTQVTLVLLSNTNPMHIAWAQQKFPEVFRLFSHAVYSYELGTAKPDPRMFREALRRAEAAPAESVYFDDIAAYAEAAAAVGMNGYQYVSVPGARDVLVMHGLTVPAHD